MSSPSTDRSKQHHVCSVCSKPFTTEVLENSLIEDHPRDAESCKESKICQCEFCHKLSQAAKVCVQIASVAGCTPELVADTFMTRMDWEAHMEASHFLEPYSTQATRRHSQ